jgi:flagellar hook-basal body complex protein FliE
MNALTTIPVSPALTAVNPPAASAPANGGGGFAEAIGAAMNQVESAQSSAKQIANDLLVGGTGDVHNVALAAQKAELSLELFQQVRNKFVQAYQEIMKMPM